MNVHPFRLCLSFIFYFLELIKLGNCCALVKKKKNEFYQFDSNYSSNFIMPSSDAFNRPLVER